MSQTNSRFSPLMTLIVIVAMLASAWYLLNKPADHHNSDDGNGHGDQASHEEEVAKGPHGGRLLVSGDFSLEMTIYETGVPPEFRLYPYINNQPAALDEVSVTIELARIDGQVDRFEFKPQQDFLRGKGVVTEPHSFDVSIKASYQGKSHQWQYENYEGRTKIAASMADESGIQTEKAGPQTIRETLTLTGRVHTDPDRLSRVRARYPGIVKSVKKKLGDTVRAGQVLATVQSNESLQTYAIKAPIGGMIVRRDIQVGEATGEEPLFIITDLSQVWAEFDVFERDSFVPGNLSGVR